LIGQSESVADLVADPSVFGDSQPPEDQPFHPVSTPSRPDRAFRLLTVAAALTSLAIVLATFSFLVDDARPAFRHSGVVGFFTHSTWDPGSGRFGVLGLAENTVLISLVALFIGVPISLAMAIFVNEYAPQRVRRLMISAIDLLAAMPSLLFGIWGLVALEGPIKHIATWLSVHLSVLPIFRVSAQHSNLTGSTFQAGVVVGVMIIPIVTSVSRDVMGQVPREQCEGALALGGTRWGMVRNVILPFGRNGIVGAILLGLGRALGETIAILFIVQQVVGVNTRILSSGSGSIASWIANLFAGADPLQRSALVAAGLTLLLITFTVNLIARLVVSRLGRFK
jgi:phosphate transport system permease protein